MKRPLLLTTTVLAATAGLPATAGAHVTLQPPEAPAGAYTVLDVRVPNEQDGAATTKVRVQFPAGFDYASTQPVPGWRAKIRERKVDPPREVDGAQVDQEVDELVLTATGAGVRPGEFQDFPVSVKLPDGKAGEALTFKALQTYSNGDVVRWIGSEASEHPAPQVTLTEPTEASTTGSHTDPAPVAAATTADDGTDGLAVVALVVGVLGLLAGAAGLVLARSAVRR